MISYKNVIFILSTAVLVISCKSDPNIKQDNRSNSTQTSISDQKDISITKDDVKDLSQSNGTASKTQNNPDATASNNEVNQDAIKEANTETLKPVAKSTEKTPTKPKVVEKSEPAVDSKVAAKPKVQPVAKPAPKPVKKPAIVFKELTYKFGEIYEGDEIKHEFIFKNTGSAPLEILSTDVTCGCTFPSYPFIAIEPGQTGHIGVSFKSVGKFGKQNPKISVKTNASATPIALYLDGFVKRKEEDKNVNEVESLNDIKNQQTTQKTPLETKDVKPASLTKEQPLEAVKEVIDSTKKGS